MSAPLSSCKNADAYGGTAEARNGALAPVAEPQAENAPTPDTGLLADHGPQPVIR
ncbi:MAG: hypothetical protein WAW46_05770 [Polaromonas sp.]